MITKLAGIFKDYKTYPKECFVDGSPVQVFMEEYPNDPYSQDLKTFISHQNYEPTQRGADLPWWGKKCFTNENGFRVFIVAQDSNTKDAGSIVFFSQLFPLIEEPDDYKKYTDKLKYEDPSERPFKFGSYKDVRETLKEWDVNFDFLYITDAAKVYRYDSWDNNDFDREKSKELLKEEIELHKPDLIVSLGKDALRILDKNLIYKDCVDKREFKEIFHTRVVVAPFLCGQGNSNPPKRFENAKSLIKEAMKK